jgi:6-pyruvoyl-tetrahydropterin synthase
VLLVRLIKKRLCYGCQIFGRHYQRRSENQFDHKNLNLDVSEFDPTTAENIAVVIWNKSKKRIEAEFDIEVVLYETARNFVTYENKLKVGQDPKF